VVARPAPERARRRRRERLREREGRSGHGESAQELVDLCTSGKKRSTLQFTITIYGKDRRQEEPIKADGWGKEESNEADEIF